MANHSNSSQPVVQGMAAHDATYKGFLNGSATAGLVCLYILVALVTFRFVDYPLNMFVGFGGIIVGVIASMIGLRAGGKWLLPVVILVLYGLFVANNVHMS